MALRHLPAIRQVVAKALEERTVTYAYPAPWSVSRVPSVPEGKLEKAWGQWWLGAPGGLTHGPIVAVGLLDVIGLRAALLALEPVKPRTPMASPDPDKVPSAPQSPDPAIPLELLD